MDFKRLYKELNNVLIPFSTDVKTQHVQGEQMVVMSFLAGLPLEFETAKSHILSDSEMSLLYDAFTRVLRIKSSSLVPSHTTNILVRHNDSGRQNNRGGNRRGFNGSRGSQHPGEAVPTSNSSGIICYYCREPGHTKNTCMKLQNKN
ncbi:hypothetical protein MANES_08G072166v8 [Manihot esculenta]|uniref:Uncharacterized protein n=1 Tax=Manihot esculenta TaxID=3983 RepID=A0ACB7HB12_MANES|nr:hypothetical protein MANES_08G072166v8 [Manihot esculenta]